MAATARSQLLAERTYGPAERPGAAWDHRVSRRRARYAAIARIVIVFSLCATLVTAGLILCATIIGVPVGVTLITLGVGIQ